jgi:hypothetical protein
MRGGFFPLMHGDKSGGQQALLYYLLPRQKISQYKKTGCLTATGYIS